MELSTFQFWNFDINFRDIIVISLCHQYRARLSCTSVQSDQVYTVGSPTSSYHLDVPKMAMDSSKNGKWIIPFKKFGRLGVKANLINVWTYNMLHIFNNVHVLSLLSF